MVLATSFLFYSCCCQLAFTRTLWRTCPWVWVCVCVCMYVRTNGVRNAALVPQVWPAQPALGTGFNKVPGSFLFRFVSVCHISNGFREMKYWEALVTVSRTWPVVPAENGCQCWDKSEERNGLCFFGGSDVVMAAVQVLFV